MPTRDGINLADLPFRAFVPLFLALLALVCAPLALTALPPLLDYPNHLARMYLLAYLDHAPVLRQFYQLAWRPLPDLAMDVLVPPLLHVMPLEWAGKLFLVATYALLTSGVAVLHRVLFGRWSAWPCLAFLLVYNRLLLWGFLNFLFGLGLALWAFAAWAAWRERGLAWRLGSGLVMALAVYFAHLMAFGVYGALVLSYEAALLRREQASPLAAGRALLVAFLPLLPPLALFAMMFIPLHGSAGMAAFGIQFARPVRKLDLLFNVFDAYSRPADIACFAVAVLGMGLGLLAALGAARPRHGGGAGRVRGALSPHAEHAVRRHQRRPPPAAGDGLAADRRQHLAGAVALPCNACSSARHWRCWCCGSAWWP